MKSEKGNMSIHPDPKANTKLGQFPPVGTPPKTSTVNALKGIKK
jgi:hypothetical protein